MRAQVIRSLDGFLGLEQEWTDLLERTESPDIYDTWDWVSLSVRQTVTDAEDLFVVVLYDQETCVAIFPLFLKRDKAAWLTVKTLLPINYKLSPYCGFCMDASYNERAILKAFMETLEERRSEWDLLKLTSQNSKRSFTFLAKSTLGEKYKTFEQQTDTSPYLSFDSHNPGKVNKREIKGIERRENKLMKEHRVQIHMDQPYRAHLWDRVLELHRDKWGDSPLQQPGYASFFEKLVQCLSQKGQAVFCYIEIDGEIEAVSLNFRYGNKVFGSVANYSCEYASYGLGLILLKNSLEHYRRLGVKELDFGGGMQPYKFYWTDTVRRRLDFVFCNNNRKKWLLTQSLSFHQFGKSSGLFRVGSRLKRLSRKLAASVIKQAIRRKKGDRTYVESRDSAKQPGMETVGS